jgi:hypothetical protein
LTRRFCVGSRFGRDSSAFREGIGWMVRKWGYKLRGGEEFRRLWTVVYVYVFV